MLGDNIESLKQLGDNSVDSIVSDPPYGLSFMNKKWDYQVPTIEFWKEVYRVLKPGGHILSFGGTRTYHRMVVNIEDAGFEIRDQIMWLYGSGFPKSLNIGKAVDKIQGNEREVYKVEKKNVINGSKGHSMVGREKKYENIELPFTKGTTPQEGWGTALKPANEPICLARKPISEKTIAENVLKWGTGGINIDGCRIECDPIRDKSQDRNMNHQCMSDDWGMKPQGITKVLDLKLGRFPANIIFDEEAAEELDSQSGISKSTKRINGKDYNKKSDNINIGGGNKNYEYNDQGGASRFFYIAKVSKAERNMGLDELNNVHPTLKPINLMTYLCRLITPKGGIILDPFMGSGSTGIAARLEGFDFIGMEMDPEYFKIAEARIENFEKYKKFIK